MCGLNSAPRNSLSGAFPRLRGLFRVGIGLATSPFVQAPSSLLKPVLSPCGSWFGPLAHLAFLRQDPATCSSLHATSVDALDATAPPVPRWTRVTDCFRRLFRSHGPTLTLLVPEPLFQAVLLSSAKTLRRPLVCTLPLLELRTQQHPRPLYFRGPDRCPRCRGNRPIYISAHPACQ
jgi:hypothetical protein